MKKLILLTWMVLGMWGTRDLAGQTFTDVGDDAGVETYLNSHGSGFFDANADGWDDIFIIHNVSVVPDDQRDNAFYRNLGNGTFSYITRDINVQGEHTSNQGLAAGDYTEDGRMDMAVGDGKASTLGTLLYHQLSSGSFETVSTGAGLTQHNLGRCLAFVDYDGDGYLDLFVAGAREDYPYLLLWQNDGDGTFTDRTNAAGLRHLRHWDDLFGFAWGDIDNDGDMDLYLPNKHYTSRFFQNNGNGTFTERSSESGLPDDSLYCGAVWLDYNSDGYIDLFARKYPTAVPYTAQLFRNNGNGTFIEVSAAAGVNLTTDVPPFGGGLSVADFNNDGHEDVLVIAKGDNKTRLFRSNGNATFANFASGAGLLSYKEYWTAPIADYNHDGYLDIYFGRNGIYGYNKERDASIVGTPSFYATLYRNNGGSNHWLHVLLRGVESNYCGISARAVAWVNGRRQTRFVRGGEGYKVDSFDMEFGLGTSTICDSLIIYWPSGIVQRCLRVPGDQRITVIEEEGTQHFEYFEFSGFLTYGSTSSAIENADIAMTGGETHNAETDEFGYYLFPEVEGAGALLVTPSKPRSEDVGSTMVSAYDAALTARHTIGLESITGTYPLQAADADRSGAINIYDAALILRYSVGQAFGGNSQAGSWVFSPTNRSYAETVDNQTDQDFIGNVIGDVDQDWTPAGAGKRIPESQMAQEFRTIRSGDTVCVSLDVPEGVEWLSSDVEMTFDPAKLRFLGIARSSGFEKAVCLSNETVPGTIRVGAYSVEPVRPSGSWGSARFAALFSEGDQAAIVWKVYRINNRSIDRGPVNLSTGVFPGREPQDFHLENNHPNPFNPQTRIEYRIRANSPVRFMIFDLRGRPIRTLVDQVQEVGTHTVVWDGKDDAGQETPSGVYMARLWSGTDTATMKMIKTR